MIAASQRASTQNEEFQDVQCMVIKVREKYRRTAGCIMNQSSHSIVPNIRPAPGTQRLRKIKVWSVKLPI